MFIIKVLKTHIIFFFNIFQSDIYQYSLYFKFNCMLLFIFSLQFLYMHVCSVALVMSNSLQLYGLYLSGSCVHGIFQARLLEWDAISFSKGSSRPKDQIHIFSISCITGRFFTHLATQETPILLFTFSFQFRSL